MRQYGRKKICKNCIYFNESGLSRWFDVAVRHRCKVDGHDVWHTKHHCDIPESFKAIIDNEQIQDI